MIMSLLGPIFGVSKTEVLTAGRDIYLAIDLSNSMGLSDVSPDRIEKVKIELNPILNSIENDRVGLALFSSQAYWQVPLTKETSIIKEYVSGLDTGILPDGGSNIESPLKLIAEKALLEKKTKRTQVLILFTDGETFKDIDPSTYESIRKADLKVFIVGVGTSIGSDITVGEKVAVSSLNSAGLRDLAQKTNGNLYFLNDDTNEINGLITKLATITSVVREQPSLIVANNRYLNFLSIAMFLMLVDLLLSLPIFRL